MGFCQVSPCARLLQLCIVYCGNTSLTMPRNLCMMQRLCKCTSYFLQCGAYMGTRGGGLGFQSNPLWRKNLMERFFWPCPCKFIQELHNWVSSKHQNCMQHKKNARNFGCNVFHNLLIVDAIHVTISMDLHAPYNL